MNKRFTNKKPYSETGMAKRYDVAETRRVWRRSIINLIKKGKI